MRISPQPFGRLPFEFVVLFAHKGPRDISLELIWSSLENVTLRQLRAIWVLLRKKLLDFFQ